jgi:hypothetical protein
MTAAPHERRAERITGIVASVVTLLGALFLTFIAWIVSGLTCDESCAEGSGQWDDNPDAWQWDFQLLWALAGLGLAIAMVALAAQGRSRAATIAFLATLLTYAGWWIFLSWN